MRVASSCLAVCLLSLGCADDPPRADGPDAGAAAYPRDGELRVTDMQLKGTHNSYHVETPGNNEPSWHYTHVPLDRQLEEQGVRMVELDIHWMKKTMRHEVFHLPYVDEGTTCRVFTDCLATLKTWSDAHPLHHVLSVMIEPKDGLPVTTDQAETYFSALEAEVLSVWPRERIVSPDDVRADAPTLRDAVTTSGWPTLGATRGKILFFVNDTADFRAAYTRMGTNTDGRLLFAQPDTTDDPYAAVMILNDPSGDGPAIEAAVGAGFLVRTFSDTADSIVPGIPELALSGGAHVISTDFPVPVPESGGYSFTIPAGTPSRCNPVRMPSGCVSADVESPDHLAR